MVGGSHLAISMPFGDMPLWVMSLLIARIISNRTNILLSGCLTPFFIFGILQSCSWTGNVFSYSTESISELKLMVG
jgi:hypothetical protein